MNLLTLWSSTEYLIIRNSGLLSWMKNNLIVLAFYFFHSKAFFVLSCTLPLLFFRWTSWLSVFGALSVLLLHCAILINKILSFSLQCNINMYYFWAHPVSPFLLSIIQRLPLKYFLDSVKLDLTTVLRMNIYSLTCRTSSGCPTDCCSWSILKLFRRASTTTNMSHMRDNWE